MFNSIKFWVIFLISILICLALFFIVLDNLTPNTSDAYLYANVVQIAPQVKGRVVRVYVKINKPVKRGEHLFQVDPRPYQIKVKKLHAELVKAIYLVKEYVHSLDMSKKQVSSLRAQVDDAKNYFIRFKKLADEGAIGRLIAIRYHDQYISLQDKLQAAEDKEKKYANVLQAKIDGENVIIKSAKANLAYAEFQLAQTIVDAPSSGYVTNVTLSAGKYAKIGTPVMVFVDTSRWWVIANIDENHTHNIAINQQVYFSLSLIPGKIFEGHVSRIAKGINTEDLVPPVYLPYVPKTINWIQLAERYPVWIKVNQDALQPYSLRVGTTTDGVIRATDNVIVNGIAYFILWVKSYFNYI